MSFMISATNIKVKWVFAVIPYGVNYVVEIEANFQVFSLPLRIFNQPDSFSKSDVDGQHSTVVIMVMAKIENLRKICC